MPKGLYYEVVGTGYPLVFLHGNGEDHNIFNNQINYFKDKYQLILIDTIMHGKSNYSYRKYNFYELAILVINVLKKEKIDKANFVGFSDGANILLHLSLLNKDIVNKAVLISGNINPRGLKFKTYLSTKLLEYKYLLTRNTKYYFYYLMGSQPKLKFKQLNKINNDFLVIAGAQDVIKLSHTKKLSNKLNASLTIIENGNHFSLINKAKEVNNIIEEYLK